MSLDLTDHVRYRCSYRRCQTECINPLDSRAAREECCVDCLDNPPERLPQLAGADD